MILEKENVIENIEKEISKLDSKIHEVESQKENIEKNIAISKRKLYGKFGTDNINLED